MPTVTFGLWQQASRHAILPLMADHPKYQHHWISCVVALGMWLAWGLPVLETLSGAPEIRLPVSALWLVPYAILGAAIFGATILRLRTARLWWLLGVELAAVAAMTIIIPWPGMLEFLIIIAWQAAMITTPARALGWVALQTLAIGALLIPVGKLDLCWVISESVALQLLLVFTALALRREANTARALARTNQELRAAQAIIANRVRDAERLRISRELHDAWGHELTALGLQLEIASHLTEPGRANDHVMQAKGLARALLAKVRDVVSALREAERCDLNEALGALAQSVSTPAVHVDISPGVRVSPDQAHALIRCAQESITNAVKHSEASNIWLRVSSDEGGVRLVARNDGSARPTILAPGTGLLGMRERVEALGGRLAVQAESALGFTVDAWLPLNTPRTA